MEVTVFKICDNGTFVQTDHKMYYGSELICRKIVIDGKLTRSTTSTINGCLVITNIYECKSF